MRQPPNAESRFGLLRTHFLPLCLHFAKSLTVSSWLGRFSLGMKLNNPNTSRLVMLAYDAYNNQLVMCETKGSEAGLNLR